MTLYLPTSHPHCSYQTVAQYPSNQEKGKGVVSIPK